MTGVEKYPTGKPGLRCRARWLAGMGASIASLTLATVVGTMVVVSPGPAAADQVSDLKAQAAQLAKDLVLEQLQIGAYQQQYDVDRAKLQRDEAAIASTQSRIQSDAQRVSRDRQRLQDEAVSAYINSDPKLNGTQVLFEGNQNEAVERAEYEAVTSGDMNLTIAALRSDENGLSTQRATLEQQESQDQATTNQEAALANDARQTSVELGSKQSEITGQLAVAVAQQQAAQAVAATKAVRAAQAAAAPASASRSVASTTSTTTTTQPGVSIIPAPAPVTGTTAGTAAGAPSLPPFLQCVLQAESGGNYAAVSPGGTYMGGFQFSQATWNEAAVLASMPQLVNVPPNVATPAQQDDLAIALYQADGQQPWNDSCRSS